MRISKHLYVHWTVPFIFLLSVPLQFFDRLSAVYIIAALHELAHVVTAGALGIKLRRVEILPFGLTMLLDANYIRVPKHEIAVAAMGPAANIVISLLYFRIMTCGLASEDFCRFIITASGMMALINLMPALPLDGGRIMKAALTIEWGFLKAFNFTVIITKILAFCFAVSGIAVLAYTRLNFSVLLIAVFLTVNIIAEKRSGDMMIMRDVIYSREKLGEGFSRGAAIVARYDKPARCLLKKFDYHRYYMISVVDEKSKYIATLSETQIIDGLMEKGPDVKLIELV